MISANSARNADCAIVVSPPNRPTWVNTNSSAAIRAALNSALFHVGGLFMRASRAAWRSAFFCSAGGSDWRRLVRPRTSTDPAALPRCLLRRLRLVWAMVSSSLEPLLDRCAVAERQVLGEVPERGFGREGDELRGVDGGMAADGGDDVGGRRRAVVLDVRGDLGGVRELDADGAHA